ncbi:MAG: hypothetical protein OEU36_09010 [Gammaproteobacteria bacterium]|nr:hypothetical protein [Gammaproteobacteria bacterium]
MTAENIPVGDPDDPPGVKFEVDQQLGEEFAIRRVDQFMVEGATKGSNCVWSYAEDIVTAAGGIFVKNNGQISNPNSAFFFADADEDLPPRSLSKFIPNCRDVTVIGENEDGFGGLTIDPATACEGTTHTPGVSQVLVNVLEIRNSAGDRVPFFGQQIGNTIEGNIDTSNFCVCNHLAEQPDEGLDGRDFACDEFTEPGELNPESGEFGCAIETGVNSRVPGGLISVNPTCSRWGTNRCY